MSWRSGTSLFLEVWPSIKKHIPDDDLRKDFSKELIQLFSNWDMDPMDLADTDPELDALIGHEPSDSSNEKGVLICIKDLKSSDPDRRKTGAEAIVSFVGYAGGALAQEAAEALAQECRLDQPTGFLIVALSSLRDLVWDEHAAIDAKLVEPLLNSPNAEVAEKAQYIIKGLNR